MMKCAMVLLTLQFARLLVALSRLRLIITKNANLFELVYFLVSTAFAVLGEMLLLSQGIRN